MDSLQYIGEQPLSSLIDYFTQKREAVLDRRRQIAHGNLGPAPLKATARAEGRSGVRRIRVRDFQIISDSPPDFAGYDLGPSSPELVLGGLASCLNHSYLIQAAELDLPIESIEVEVEGLIDPRAGAPGYESTPVYPQNLSYVVRIASPAADAEIKTLRDNVEKFCPILNLLKQPQKVEGRLDVRLTADAVLHDAAANRGRGGFAADGVAALPVVNRRSRQRQSGDA
jgi:uncharacterized OsmC-like protein